MKLLWVLLVAAQVHTAPSYRMWKTPLPYEARWGAYRVRIEPKDDDNAQRLLILDKLGRAVREVRAQFISNVESVRLTGHSPAELRISLWSGGAYASFTDVFFTLRGGLRNVLVFDGEDLGVREIIDLNRDGIPEIIADNPALGDCEAYTFHRHYPLVTILGWTGQRYVDVTRRYPRRSLQEANRRRQAILDALRDMRHDWEVHDMVVAYYANMLNAGHGAEGRRWLRQHLPQRDEAWLRLHEAEVRRVVATSAQRRAHVTQARVIEQE